MYVSHWSTKCWPDGIPDSIEAPAPNTKQNRLPVSSARPGSISPNRYSKSRKGTVQPYSVFFPLPIIPHPMTKQLCNKLILAQFGSIEKRFCVCRRTAHFPWAAKANLRRVGNLQNRLKLSKIEKHSNRKRVIVCIGHVFLTWTEPWQIRCIRLPTFQTARFRLAVTRQSIRKNSAQSSAMGRTRRCVVCSHM